MKTREPLSIKNNGKVVAVEATIATEFDAEARRGLNRYVAYIKWAGDEDIGEEIDVDAVNAAYARMLVRVLLDRDYLPGGEIASLEEKFGMYM